jgi:FtsP/CotA-like multicopper oxidase with cupredoxin domain
MSPMVRSKKIPVSTLSEASPRTGLVQRNMVRIGRMSNRIPLTGRREFMAGFGAAAIAAALPGSPATAGRSATLQARAYAMALGGGPATPVWGFESSNLRFERTDVQEITFENSLPAPAVLNWRGILGASAAEPLLSQTALAPNGRGTFAIPLRYAGTFTCDIRLLGDGAARPSRPLLLMVAESEPVAVDRDVFFLVEDWRLRPDGTAIAPGSDPKDARPAYTVNGLSSLDVTAHANERLRFRFINGCQRAVIGLKLEGLEVRVMALDSRPAEPFTARNGAFAIAPGGRLDAILDVTSSPGSTSPILLHDGKEVRPIGRLITSTDPPFRSEAMPPAPPLPSNGLAPRLELKNALRFELALGGSHLDWIAPMKFAASAPPAFRAKAGRTVVLALTNRAETTTVFHLHGHHFRLLDRLDDGWKPFWLDTLAIEAGQTQRIAFAAEFAGRWLIEQFGADWAAPRLVRWYSVE